MRICVFPHFFSTFTTSAAETYINSPEDSSSMVQDPCSSLSSFPTCPIQQCPTVTTLLPSDGIQGRRCDGSMEICVGFPFWTTDTTTSFGSGRTFWVATGTVFAVSLLKLACGDDAGMPKIWNGMRSSLSTSWMSFEKSQCVWASPG